MIDNYIEQHYNKNAKAIRMALETCVEARIGGREDNVGSPY